MPDEIPQGSGPIVETLSQGRRTDAQSRYAAELCGGQNSRAVWEVIDRTRKPLSRVICRTNRADAMMIVHVLNAKPEGTVCPGCLGHGGIYTEIIGRYGAAERTYLKWLPCTCSARLETPPV